MNKRIIKGLAFVTAFFLFSFSIIESPTGIDESSMDKKVNPGTNFYLFANGTWLAKNPVPASESKWSNFNIVTERNNEVLRQLLEKAASDTNAAAGSTIQKVGTFYRLFMDTLKRDAEGIKPLVATYQKINDIQNKSELIGQLAELHEIGIRGFFGFYVSQDLKKSTSYICYLSQSGLGLPDRDYYTKTDKRSEDIRNAYKKHIAESAKLFGIIDTNFASDVFAIEYELAMHSMTRTERRNQEKQYNKFSFAELNSRYPNLKFDLYFKTNQINSPDSIIVSQPDFFAHLNHLVDSLNLSQLKQYVLWNAFNTSMGYLGSSYERKNFEFYGTILSGAKEQKPLWKRGISAANNIVGELLGQLFVEKVFTADSKQQVNAMVDLIVEAFKVRINQLEWMSAETKKMALVKLNSFNRKFGYPDVWTDYKNLEIKPDSYLENYFRASSFSHKDMLSKLGKPIDRNKWSMLPQTVNAYYSPTLNEIVFPAAIMQAPFFDPKADPAINFGSIGAVIGHELTHGFDDQGSKYGADGNLKSWWTNEDRAQFEKRTQKLTEQYNAYKMLDSLPINGALTLGENIADFGGLTIAFEALKMYTSKNPLPVINGFTAEQRFFIGFAQVWKNNARPETIRQLIMTDPHSPGEFRVVGTLSNMPSFFEAFGVQKGQKMFKNPEERVVIW
jgi:putative endopeptidase